MADNTEVENQELDNNQEDAATESPSTEPAAQAVESAETQSEETQSEQPQTADSAAETSPRSEEFAGQWHGLISTTNWEKGRIILEWREALIDEGASATAYSDDSWSQIVGAVTPQHVGRLRRVYERFQAVYGDYKGLYWSHFHAAIDWEDAEMWLEGAVQNNWSVSQMRKQRWETMGQLPDQKPDDKQIVASEVDEDVVVETSDDATATVSSSFEAVENLDKREASEEESKSKPKSDSDDDLDEDSEDEEDSEEEPQELSRPFADLPTLPDDVTEAFEA
ncbi:MAG: hypothetical protein AAF497_04740, partial [Planctomycetota bacterium]